MIGMIKTINLVLEGWGVLISLFAVFILLSGIHMEKRTKRYFIEVFLCVTVNLLANITGILLKGRSGAINHLILEIANFFEFFFGYLLTYSLSLLLIHTVETAQKGININKEMDREIDKNKIKMLQIWRGLTAMLFGIATVLLLVSQFNHMYYWIDEQGYYHRQGGFWLSQIIAVVSMLFNIGYIQYFKKILGKKKTILFLVLIIGPILALLIQVLIYGIYFALLFAVIATVILLVYIMKEQLEMFYETERELSRMQTAIVQSQIKPHFLYNSLTAIAQLCEKDPKKAKKATIAFAEYLRTNMKSLDGCRIVSFEEELAHIKTYLFLEQMRFGEDLKVVMDIQETSFCLPALSIQPLVENAVKWGVGQKEDGGTVTLSVHRENSIVQIQIIDDGVGMQVGVKPTDGRTHLGMENVRKRLTEVCGASMQVESTLGKGTMVTVIIPCEA